MRQEPVPETGRAGEAGPDRTLFSRFENKYLVPGEIVPAMRRWLAPFMRPDDYAAPCPGFMYPICSLYLDSNDLALYKTTVHGIKNRFKLRIRSYSEDPLMPVFCELKRRMNGVIMKRRARVDREEIPRILDGFLPHADALHPGAREAFDEFRALMLTSRAHPVIRVRYLREAYVAKGGDPVRVTFDTELGGCPTLDASLARIGGRWLTVPLQGTIVEIKFTERYPSWIADLIRAFELQKRSVAKYVMCVNRMLQDARSVGAQRGLAGLRVGRVGS